MQSKVLLHSRSRSMFGDTQFGRDAHCMLWDLPDLQSRNSENYLRRSAELFRPFAVDCPSFLLDDLHNMSIVLHGENSGDYYCHLKPSTCKLNKSNHPYLLSWPSTNTIKWIAMHNILSCRVFNSMLGSPGSKYAFLKFLLLNLDRLDIILRV